MYKRFSRIGLQTILAVTFFTMASLEFSANPPQNSSQLDPKL